MFRSSSLFHRLSLHLVRKLDHGDQETDTQSNDLSELKATPTNGGKQVFVSQEALDTIEELQFKMQTIDIKHARLHDQ